VRPRCPICSAELDAAAEGAPSAPFCSARCKKIDLGNWLGGAYRISTPLDAEAAAELVERDEHPRDEPN
jgi:uncharacterized protein